VLFRAKDQSNELNNDLLLMAVSISVPKIQKIGHLISERIIKMATHARTERHLFLLGCIVFIRKIDHLVRLLFIVRKGLRFRNVSEIVAIFRGLGKATDRSKKLNKDEVPVSSFVSDT